MIDAFRMEVTGESPQERLAAALTHNVYLTLLDRGLQESWITVELKLWSAVRTAVDRWTRELPPSSDKYLAWQDGFVADLTDHAAYVARQSGFDAPVHELRSSVSLAFQHAWSSAEVQSIGSQT